MQNILLLKGPFHSKYEGNKKVPTLTIFLQYAPGKSPEVRLHLISLQCHKLKSVSLTQNQSFVDSPPPHSKCLPP